MSRLRDSPDDRFALVGAAADHFRLADPAFVEKDFWVVELLRSLVAPLPIEPIDGKQGHAQVVFKGGTSLSKAFGIIERFSEDVDILVVCSDNLGAGAREKRVLRPLCDRVAADMAFAPEQIGRGSYKTGFTRNVTYLYPAAYEPSVLSEGVFHQMGIRGGTQPGTRTRPVRSFIADYLESTGDGEAFRRMRSGRRRRAPPGLWEPYDGRLSRTVPKRAGGGAIPLSLSPDQEDPTFVKFRSCSSADTGNSPRN